MRSSYQGFLNTRKVWLQHFKYVLGLDVQLFLPVGAVKIGPKLLILRQVSLQSIGHVNETTMW